MKLEPEKTDAAWELLLQARRPEVRPDFAAGVLRAISTEPAPGKVVAFPPWRWVLPVAAAAVVMLGLFITFLPKPSGPAVAEVTDVVADSTQELVQVGGEDEFAGLEDYSALLAVEDAAELSDAEILALLN